MKIYDAGKILTGLVLFFVLLGFPIWYNIAAGKATYRPEPLLPTDTTMCIAETDYMTHFHMDLLNDWRDKVVRQGERYVVGRDGKKYEMSLTLTCLKCHSHKKKFCDACHNYLGVNPYCWECHVVPEEVK